MDQLSNNSADILAAAPPLPLHPAHWDRVVDALGLSKQEARIVELVLRDLCNKQIAVVLKISSKTVEEHLYCRIPKKTRTNSRMQLAMRVLEIALRVRE